MAFSLFKKAQEEAPKGPRVHDVLADGLQEMERKGIDRIVLSAYETEPNGNATGRWISTDQTHYYPFEMLDETEQEMIEDSKHYTVIALVRDAVGDVVRYKGAGLEAAQRTHIHPMLPKLHAGSPLNYVTHIQLHTGEDLKEFSKGAAEAGWKPKIISQKIAEGVGEYQAITHALMDAAGVHSALERMERREYTPFEQIMNDLRSNIASAKDE